VYLFRLISNREINILRDVLVKLDKAVTEVRWYQNQHTTLKIELRNTQEAFESHSKDESLISKKLVEENQRISSELEDLRVSHKVSISAQLQNFPMKT